MTVVSNPNEHSVEGLVDTGSGNQRVIMTQSVEGTQQDYSENSVECIVEDSSGNKQRCVCVNNFGGGGSSGGVTSVNGQTGDVTITASGLGAIQNNSTGDGSVSILGISASIPNAISIGKNANGTSGGVAIGFSATSGSPNTVGIGDQTYTGSTSAIAIGSSASVMYNSGNGIAIGNSAKLANNATNSIQLGTGQTDTVHTFSVGFSGLGNYPMLDGQTGLIPAARLGAIPSSDGNYRLRLTISGGTPTVSWVAE